MSVETDAVKASGIPVLELHLLMTTEDLLNHLPIPSEIITSLLLELCTLFLVIVLIVKTLRKILKQVSLY